MNSREIRDSFVRFFTDRGHRAFDSAPLVPQGDPTLLFINAGMVPFKDFFLGAESPPAPRAVSVQKCLRVSGKHNDLENVGPSPRHHTFFEMLGNFSFGDYFKEEAIRFGWELVTGVWGLPPQHLAATVFEEDEEAAALWKKVADLPDDRIHRCGKKDNFWAMGETGPCGPCSEIFVDRSPDQPPVAWDEGTESGRYLEIWNLVFMQFDRGEDGKLRPLPNPSIDTGAGLERVAAVLQGVDSNYDTDLFQPTLKAAAELAGTAYGRSEDGDVSLRVIADHLRAIAFLLADGVIPGNEGRGYVLRRLLRRAARHGMRLGLEEPFLHGLLPVVDETLGDHYPELAKAEISSSATVRAEEEKFLSTVATASRLVQEEIDQARARGESRLGGEQVFRFYDTFGLPIDVIREIAEEESFGVDEEGFAASLEAQRARSREASGDSGLRMADVRSSLAGEEVTKTRFVGYESLLQEDCEAIELVRLDEDRPRRVELLDQGSSGVVILDRTPFYAESGGQVGDRGELIWPGGRAAVLDCHKDPSGVFYHFVEIAEGDGLRRSHRVRAVVDEERRWATQRNHTATHLLHAALRRVLGQGVRQAGSLVAPDRLRFDFTYHQALAPEQVEEIEALVNRWILAASPTAITEDRPFEEALAAGAIALFGEKYGDRVRTVEIADLDRPEDDRSFSSLELCGGCHVANTGQIGLFLVVSERSVASGVRRIEALTGTAARGALKQAQQRLRQVAETLEVPAERAAAEIGALREELRQREKQLSQMRLRLVSGGAGDEEATVSVEGIEVLAKEVPPAPAGEIRNMADVLKAKLGTGVVVLASREAGKVTLITAVSQELADRIHAGRLTREIAERVGGTGGGRPDFAQGGGKQPERIAEALEAVPALVRELLNG